MCILVLGVHGVHQVVVENGDLGQCRWEALQPMRMGRYSGEAAALGGFLYVVGGIENLLEKLEPLLGYFYGKFMEKIGLKALGNYSAPFGSYNFSICLENPKPSFL